MYQHLNEDGTPYIFFRGVDYYTPSPVQVLTRSTFDYYPVYDSWVVDPLAEGLPRETISDEESELDLGDVDPDNGNYFALTRLVCLQNLSCKSSVVNADKRLF